MKSNRSSKSNSKIKSDLHTFRLRSFDHNDEVINSINSKVNEFSHRTKSNIKINENNKNSKLKRIILEKRETYKLNQLKSDNKKMLKLLGSLKDPKSLALLSKNINRATKSIKLIMNNFEKRDYDDKIQKDSDEECYATDKNFSRLNTYGPNSFRKNLNYETTRNDLNHIVLESRFDSKDEIKNSNQYFNSENTSEKNYKITKILTDYKIMNQKEKFDLKNSNTGVPSTPNFRFLRTNVNKTLYNSSTNMCGGTLFNKSFRPPGFRSSNSSSRISLTQNSYGKEFYRKRFEDILDDDSMNYNKTFAKKTIKSAFITSPSTKLKRDSVVSRPFSAALFNIQYNLESEVTRKFRYIFLQLLTNCKIISNHLRKNLLPGNMDENREKEYDDLLKVYEIRKQFLKKNEKNIGVNVKEKKIENIKKLPNKIAAIYNQIYNQIENEDRLLNKEMVKEISPIELKLQTSKMKKKIRKLAWETMSILVNKKDNALNYKDEDKIFLYQQSNKDNLEWQMIKSHFLKDNNISKF